jgi:UDP-N-acetyl-D-mannosaminuronate dehydrogenase
MILAGRRFNDGMATYVDVIKTMLRRKQRIDGARVLVMGFTFKEDVPDTRNTKIVDLVCALRDFVAEVAIYDPMADVDLAKHEWARCCWQSSGGAVRHHYSCSQTSAYRQAGGSRYQSASRARRSHLRP